MSFQFKQFSVSHESSSMKVGTDAVLLGAFIQTEKQEKILEVGTGCGVVALMLAQKGNRVLAIDIHAPSVEEAQQNFSNSVFASLLIADEIDFFKLQAPVKFDRIVSNPPFFQNSLQAPDDARNAARHAVNDWVKRFWERANKLTGRVNVIVPVEVFDEWKRESELSNFFLVKKCEVFSRSDKPAIRFILEFYRIEQQLEESSLVLMNEDGTRTKEYGEFASSYYL
ncbi:MAG: methyltransferase [Flavobacteriales bacterium]|nr:methyltransferase [Flavobacteriales bacterium]MDP4717526.1 methyltransferase [Flavobacteriales bacterium]MDP4730480.1 methyltransferase [Flavobacteriales bacterium]MDP4817602.1 methyltransferase [Flavobacteriales bacterium]